MSQPPSPRRSSCLICHAWKSFNQRSRIRSSDREAVSRMGRKERGETGIVPGTPPGCRDGSGMGAGRLGLVEMIEGVEHIGVVVIYGVLRAVITVGERRPVVVLEGRG